MTKFGFEPYTWLDQPTAWVLAFSGGPLCHAERSPFEFNKIKFDSVLQYLVFTKATHFEESALANLALATTDFRELLKLSRSIERLGTEMWRANRRAAALRGNLAKFRQNAALAKILLKTGGRVLAYADTSDRLWGMGIAGDHPQVVHPHLWPGQNLMGYVLMDVRRMLLD